MKVCPKCGFRESPLWKPLYWKLYWWYMPLADFKREFPKYTFLPFKSLRTKKCVEGNFTYHFEDQFYYYKVAGKTRKMIHRFPKGFESVANKKLFEKTPSEKDFPNGDIFQKKLVEKSDVV